MTFDKKIKLRSCFYVMLQGIIYGICSPLSKLAYETIPVNLFLTGRYLVSSLFLLLLFSKIIIPELKHTPLKHYVIPTLCLSTASLFSNLALRYSEATCVDFLRSLGAVFVPVISLLCFKGKYTRKTAIIQVMIIIGMYMICMKGGRFTFGRGEFMALLSAVFVAVSLVFGGNALNYVDARTLSFAQLVCATGISFVCAALNGTLNAECIAAFGNMTIILILLYAGIISSAAGHMLQNIALKNISSRLVGVIQCLSPVFTMLFSYLIIKERLTVCQIIGACILFICIEMEASGKKDNVQRFNDCQK